MTPTRRQRRVRVRPHDSARYPEVGYLEHNRPVTAAQATGALSTVATIAMAAVDWPLPLEAALVVLVGFFGGRLIGRVAQRGTWPDYKVQRLQSEVRGHGDSPLDEP